MYVIIGAGPAGLLTAIRLKKAGINDLVIYDPRAGIYTRPGHLNRDVFLQSQSMIRSATSSLWPNGKAGHIKDLERALHDEALQLGIKIEKKFFMRLHQDIKTPGVIVADGAGNEETVFSNYVFDCTGQQRRVVNAVNELVIPPPFTLETFTELPVTNHFIAYIKMDANIIERITGISESSNILPPGITALSYALSMIKLRSLGWKEFLLPGSYGVNFGKGKVCAYFYMPENLSKENHDLWVQTVLNSYIGHDVAYSHLSPSKKYASKPRFVAFATGAQALEQVAYKGVNLPIVIPLGDTQIDFDYELAHGIFDGNIRIDILFDHLTIANNEIDYFDESKYRAEIAEQLSEHKQAIAGRSSKTKRKFVSALEQASIVLRQALSLSSDHREKMAIDDMLVEVEARISYMKASYLFIELNKKGKQTLSLFSRNALFVSLDSLHDELVKALQGLPVSLVTERSETQTLLTLLAQEWKELGHALFKNKEYAKAREAYKKALAIYDLPALEGKYSLKQVPLYFNLLIVCKLEKCYSEVIEAATSALTIYEKCSVELNSPHIEEMFLCNLLKALFAQAEVYSVEKNHQEADKLHTQARCLLEQHKRVFSSANYMQMQVGIELLGKQRESISLPNSLGGSSRDGEAGNLTVSSESRQGNSAVLQRFGTFSVNPDSDKNTDPNFAAKVVTV